MKVTAKNVAIARQQAAKRDWLAGLPLPTQAERDEAETYRGLGEDEETQRRHTAAWNAVMRQSDGPGAWRCAWCGVRVWGRRRGEPCGCCERPLRREGEERMIEREAALRVASEVATRLRPACEKVALAGSLRRGKDQVHDIEIVIQPHFDTNLLGERLVSYGELDAVIKGLVEDGTLSLDTQVLRNGRKLKRFIANALDAPFEFYIASARNFGAIHTIRTGDKDFSRALVTSVEIGGFMPATCAQIKGSLWQFPSAMYAQAARSAAETSNGTVIPCPTEKEYFAALGLPWIAPEDRHQETVRNLLAMSPKARLAANDGFASRLAKERERTLDTLATKGK